MCMPCIQFVYLLGTLLSLGNTKSSKNVVTFSAEHNTNRYSLVSSVDGMVTHTTAVSK